MRRHLALTLSLLAIGLYAASLFYPAFACSSKSFLGYEVLAIGWAGLLALDPRWFANIGFWVLMYRTLSSTRRIAPRALGVTALLAITSFIPAAGCAARGGAPGISTGLALGGFLWVGSAVIACFSNLAVVARVPDSTLATVEGRNG